MKIINQKLFGVNAVIGLPESILSNIVDSFFELQGKPEYMVHRLLPKGTSEILFNFGDTFYGVNSLKNNLRKVSCKHYLISGIKTSYFDSLPADYFHCTGIRFKIDGMKKLFDITPEVFTDNDYELDLVISKSSASQCYEKLYECKSPSEKFKFLENWLLKRFISPKHPIKTEPVVNAILAKPFTQINLLEKETGFSRQYLHRSFKTATGISIKRYQQIRRILRVLNSIKDCSKPLAMPVYLSGYFDQSHFIKDFKNVTGFSPSAFPATAGKQTLDPYLF
jgi:AraC-like DNA-binding protein